MSLNNYSEAYEIPNIHSFEKKENQQAYDFFVSEYQHVKPKRHELGIVGGNEVYNINGNRSDLESDLLGITRPNTWGTSRHHLPSKNPNEIARKNPKIVISVEANPIPREEYQMWSYPSVFAPLAFKKESCTPKNKF